MLISDLLRHKNPVVITIAPAQPVAELLRLLAEHHIGAVVVTEADAIVGIISERDIVRRLDRDGAAALTGAVADLMTTSVISCLASDPVDAVATIMTERRIRHMPVLADGRLAGIVTIGDVVAARLRSLEVERRQLEEYITQG
jgi:CBS domain-containing protein